MKIKGIFHKTFLSSYFVPMMLAAILLVVAQYNFLLFHTLAEVFAIIVAIIILVVSWYMFPFTRNAFLMYLGCGYFWIGVLDLLHSIHYKGVTISADAGGNASTQFWIVTRYIEALLLLSSPWFLSHGIYRRSAFFLFGIIALSMVYFIKSGYFPVSYIEGQGLTPFKIYSEYIIIGLLLLAIFYLHSKRRFLENKILSSVIASIILTACGELAFTFYVHVYDLSNLVGHIFKLFSYWLIFLATIRTTLQEPFVAMSRGANTYDAVPDAIIVVDRGGVIREANQSAARLAGIDKSDLIGLNSHDLYHPEHTDEIECELCEAVKSSREIQNLELRADQFDGWFDYSISKVSGLSGMHGSVEVMRDITKRKKSEVSLDKLRLLKDTIVENLPLMLFVKDAEELRYVEWNKKAEEMTGVSKENMLGNNDYNFWPREEAEFFVSKDREVLNKGVLLDIPQEPISTKKGNYILHTKKIPIYNDEGEASYLLGIAEDITTKLQTEQAIRQTQKMDAMGNLSGGIAHDYNNMLGIIIGYCELMSEMMTDNPKAIEHLKEIRRAARRGEKLTKKLLGFSRKRATEESPVDINQLLRDERDMLEKTLTVRINLVLDLDDNLWLTWIDIHDLEDALLNLAINAMHAMEGGGTLTVRTHNETVDGANAIGIPEGKYVLLEMSDTGCGIEEEKLEKIFEPFYSTKGKAGTGLGLSQVYGFVKRSNAYIYVNSTPGMGTTFYLYFPQHVTEVMSEDKPSEFIDSDMLRGSESILVVDDEPAIARLMDTVLSDAGYKVYVALGGKEALDILAREKIDLVLSDVLMPGMDGYELSHTISKTYPEIKIQLISGYSEHKNKSMVDEELYNEILFKPVDRHRMLKKLRSLLA